MKKGVYGLFKLLNISYKVKIIMRDEKVILNIPVFEILLVLGIIAIVMGAVAPVQKIDFFGLTIWLEPKLSIICIPIGIGLVCGYITRKILPAEKKGYIIGFFLGKIGLIISICIRQKNNINSNNKYEYIEKLENLKNNGTITDVEFEREKSKILKEEKINESNNE